MTKKLLFVLIAIFGGILSLRCSGNGAPPNILLLPQFLALDTANSRLFVVDSANNGLSLIDTTNNGIVTGNPLLNSENLAIIPQLPQDIAAVTLGNGVSRVFVIGNPPTNVMTVLEYDSVNGLHLASPPFITVGTNSNAQLSGLQYDPVSGNLFVSDSTDSQVHAINAVTESEAAGSPIAVNAIPRKMGLNSAQNLLFVSSLGSTSVSVINTANLSTPPASVDVGIETSSVASASNGAGTVLFTVSPTENQVSVFNYNTGTSSITPVGSPILPPVVGQPLPANNVLSGAASQVAAGVLTNGEIAGLITQSTGDLGFIDVASDLSGIASQGLIPVLNAQGATGIVLLGSTAYFAAPGGSSVSFVNIETNQFIGQLL